MRSLRPALQRSVQQCPRPLQQCIRFPRTIHSTSVRLADSNFTEDGEEDPSLLFGDTEEVGEPFLEGRGSVQDQLAYARQATQRGMRRWQESQEPKGKVQFMTMGKEFTMPYNMTQLSYMSLNHMRELRTYYRKIMYEMPQFSKFHRTFRPPTKFEVLRFRYSSYLGEKHPAAKKVVLTVHLKKLRESLQTDDRFDDAWEHKFKLLCGTRYTPDDDLVHMSCEQYPYPAQNKRWLSDKLDEMVQAAATGETFGDIPFDNRHIKKKRVYEIPKDWLKLSPERQKAEKAVEEEIYIPAMARCIQLSKVSSINEIPERIQKRLRGIVNSTVRHAVRPGFFADLNDPQVREMIINESIKHLVWSFNRDETRQADFITPDLSEEEFEAAFTAEKVRLEAKKRDDQLRTVEDEKQRLYNEQQKFASDNVADEISEVTQAELDRARQGVSATKEDDDIENLDINDVMKKALKAREERRKLILSRNDEPDIPTWLKHAVDTEDTEYFPMASGRFSRQKHREELLAEFFQQELSDVKMGSEEETKLLEFMEKFVDEEESGLVEEESVESIKKRVNAMLKEIEDRKDQTTER